MFRCTPSALFKSLAVWGGGTMGGGIAQVTAQAGVPVTVVEISKARLDVSRKMIEASLLRIANKKCDKDESKMKTFVDTVLSHITFTTNESVAAGNAELIIEAIVENIDAKKELFARLDKMAPRSTVFCSNTSSLSITEMASVTTRKERFAGLHFFSPVPMMKLLEVVRTEEVKPEVIEQLSAFCKKVGKIPVIAKDTPGFIVNRLLVPYQMEACRLVERGVATFQDVDTAMKFGCGYPMGPFELSDSVGIDVIKFIVDGWHDMYPDEPLFKPSPLINERVAAGKLGKKTGEGYYKYDSKGHRINS
ncbi:3-hydroxyacyl-CoA dehydrogenase, NAD binding domain [Leishmania utingensis]|uniref:3-hydroxyacyl-CoA dehydrogenase, NAD binding domain n=1 Tax=Leishmania utingensis TaxID=653362 RepID=A0AAW2ZTQ6_9TRYP